MPKHLEELGYTIPVVSKRFNAKDSDVIFRSADNVLFRVHRVNLETHAAGFPPAEFKTFGEIVPLTEDSITLERLFQFMYPQPQPDLELLPPESLFRLAEAVEKYQIFSAITICNVYMRKALPQHVVEVVSYAVRHGYYDIADEAALLLLNASGEDIATNFPQGIAIALLLYREDWNRVLRNAMDSGRFRLWAQPVEFWISEYIGGKNVTEVRQTSRICGDCECNVDLVVLEILGQLKDIKSLQNLDVVFAKTGCVHIEGDIQSWRTFVDREIRDMKPFSKYL